LAGAGVCVASACCPAVTAFMWGCNRTGRATKRSCQARGGWGGLMTLGYIGASADIGHCGRHMGEPRLSDSRDQRR